MLQDSLSFFNKISSKNLIQVFTTFTSVCLVFMSLFFWPECQCIGSYSCKESLKRLQQLSREGQFIWTYSPIKLFRSHKDLFDIFSCQKTLFFFLSPHTIRHSDRDTQREKERHKAIMPVPYIKLVVISLQTKISAFSFVRCSWYCLPRLRRTTYARFIAKNARWLHRSSSNAAVEQHFPETTESTAATRSREVLCGHANLLQQDRNYEHEWTHFEQLQHDEWTQWQHEGRQ